MQRQSMVRRAAEEFAHGNYLAALDLYKKLSDLLGERNFRANVWLCGKRLKNLGRRDCADLPLAGLRVACIMDEFSFQCYRPECNLFPLTPESAIAEMEAFGPDLLFVESAWCGKDDLWSRKISTLSHELRSALQWCKERQVPTAFWNKEDPIHFETFLTTAQQFDLVFTTDIDCIGRYKAALGHERVYLLPFACQPKIHNPVELYPRKDAFCFAGAYYVRYPERIRDLENYVAELPKYRPLDIFDRNFGKKDINYKFPSIYEKYIVGTLPFNEIDRAYKGYVYSINLNSIKQSQSMFARRVYELLGSNTITVSNFSRGMRLLFGDLVIASDSGKEIVERLQRLNEESSQKLRLTGLRKVMLEHTYGHRLAYVARKTLGWHLGDDLPVMVVVALVGSQDDYRRMMETYQAQRHMRKRLLIVLSAALADKSLPAPNDETVTVVTANTAATSFLGNGLGDDEWLALMALDDYYGPNYLLDLAAATRYSDARLIGKASRYQWAGDGIRLLDPGLAYQPAEGLPMRSSAIRSNEVPREQTLLAWVTRALDQDWKRPGLAIDPFNYCLNGRQADDPAVVRDRVDDPGLDAGLPVGDLIQAAEHIPPAEFDETTLPRWGTPKLTQVFGQIKHPKISIENNLSGLCIQSDLPDGTHEYIYAEHEVPLSSVSVKNTVETYLDATPGLDVQYVFLFLDDKKQRIDHVIHKTNRNNAIAVPAGAAFLRMGWRVCGRGTSVIKSLLWGHRKLETARLFGRSDTLLLTNHYPSYDDLYRNGFVHSRVKAYRDHGVSVDVFRLRATEAVSYHEFQNIDVVTGGQQALSRMLESGRYKQVLVHFLSPDMWAVLEKYPDLKVIVWIHGAEIQPWHRRAYNYQNEQERAKAMRESERRVAFWRGVLKPMPSNLTLVFVSRYSAEEVFKDLGLRVPDDAYTIIHNPIDTELFSYEPKPVEQRKRILSIRPYTSLTYANDLSVKAILNLSMTPHFEDMEFRIIGDGKLFDETLEPLRKFQNVIIERGFLTHTQIAILHKEYGVFLVPSRMDSQGVSRDEAMASGLVPITTSVAAIPEFVDNTCGILAPPEDVAALADGITTLYQSPALFDQLSKAAAQRVIQQRASSRIVEQEIVLVKPAVCRIDDGRPISFISFDVEALPGRASQSHIDRLIWGRFDGEEYGIRRISHILKQYGIKGNFLIDFSSCLLDGDKKVQDIVNFLLEEGHEVHVHLHAEWVIRKWGLPDKEWPKPPVGMHLFDDALNYSLLQFAAFKYCTLVGKMPVVFRAGGFKFNASTVNAAQKIGFKACSNFNSARHSEAWSSRDPRVVNNEPFRWKNGLIELPVDFSPEPLSHDWEKYQGSFDRVLSRKSIKTFNLTLHSWSLLTRDTGEHFTGFSAAHEERLHRICQHLKENTRSMSYTEFLSAGVEFPEETDCQCILTPSATPEPLVHCGICGATYRVPLRGDICPSCEARARHRQLLDVLNKIGNPFDGHSVLACHANSVEMQAFLAKATQVTNFDVRPLADLQMDIQSMDKIENGRFDTFIAIHVLNHVADDRKALKEIHRVLKPNGVALITVPCRENSGTEPCENITEHYGKDALTKFGVGTYRRYGLQDVIDLFSNFFKVKQYKGFDKMTLSYGYVFVLTKDNTESQKNS